MKVLAVLRHGYRAAQLEPQLLTTIENQRKWLESLGHEYVIVNEESDSSRQFHRHLADAEVLIYTPLRPANVTRDLMNKAKNLKLCITAGSGSDCVDADAAVERDMQVLIVPGFDATSIAEQAVANILLLVRNLVPSYQTTERDWQVSSIAPHAYDLRGKVVGTIGAGDIAFPIMQRLKPFECEQFFYYDRKPLEDYKAMEVAARRVLKLEDLVSQCDIVTVNGSFHEGTKGLINPDLLKRFKKGAWLVNTAHGAISDRNAIAEAVRDGRLRGYADDVQNPQSLTVDAQQRYVEGTRCLLDNYLIGKQQDPKNIIVDLKRQFVHDNTHLSSSWLHQGSVAPAL